MAKPMYDIIFRNCKNCSKEFMIEHPRQLYCCEDCKKEYKKKGITNLSNNKP